MDGRYQAIDPPRRQNQRTVDRLFEEHNAANEEAFRPLEDPYLVGEQAAAEARKERLSRERLNTSLQQEERHWDWLIGMYRMLVCTQYNKPANVQGSTNERMGSKRTQLDKSAWRG